MIMSDETRKKLRASRMEVLKGIKLRTPQEQVELEAYEVQIRTEFSDQLVRSRAQKQSHRFLNTHQRKLGRMGQRFSKSPNKGTSPSHYEAFMPDGTKVSQISYGVHMYAPTMAAKFSAETNTWVPIGICDPLRIPKKKVPGILTGRIRLLPATIVKWGHA